MFIREFAEKFKADHPNIKDVYVAVMPNDGQWDLEIEINEGTIGATYRTDKALEGAREDADNLEVELRKFGIFCFYKRENWEAYLSERSEA